MHHTSNGTTHDPSFVELVLENITEKRGINHGTVMIKSDNAPTQYRYKWTFGSMQRLTGKYSVTVTRVYGAAGHGKGLIDAMSSFGVNNTLRQSMITNDWWFEISLDICSHITARCNQVMSYYTALVSNDINKKRENRITKQLVRCSSMTVNKSQQKWFHASIYVIVPCVSTWILISLTKSTLN